MANVSNYSAGGPASPESIANRLIGGQTSRASITQDHQYSKGRLKGKIELTKLNADNYHDWSCGMELLLKTKNVWLVVNGTITLPDPKNRPIDSENWLIDDAQAQVWICLNIEDSQYDHILGKPTSNAMWAALKVVHDPRKPGRLNFLLTKFCLYKAGSTETIDEVASELARLQTVIRDIDPREAPTDLAIALKMFNAINGDEYSFAKAMLEDVDNLTLELVRSRFKSVEQRLKYESSRQGATANKTSKGQDGRKCFYCKKPGHVKIRCYRWLATDEGKKWMKTHHEEETASKTDDRKAKGKDHRGQSKKSWHSHYMITTFKPSLSLYPVIVSAAPADLPKTRDYH